MNTLLDFKAVMAEHEAHWEDGNPSVYVGTYGKYNGGSIEGMWVDLTKFDSYEEFIGFCRDLHNDEADPELMFQDYEGYPRSWYSESCMGKEIFDKIIEYAQLTDDEKEAYDAYIDNINAEGSLEDFRDAYLGDWDREVDFAEHIADNLYFEQMNDFCRQYFDFEAFARDLFMCDYTFIDGHVFYR